MGRTLKKINGRMTKSQSDRHRLSIQTSKLVKRLQEVSAGTAEMTPVQLKATQILIDKSLPNLQAIAVDNVQEAPILSAQETMEKLEEFAQEYLKGLPDEKKREILGENIIELKEAQTKP
jgi:tRNA uridine 5-carbamoylmethylation protein Kti12